MRTFIVVLFCIVTSSSYGVSLYADDGTYLGELNSNEYDPNSVSNPYGKYGNPYNADSINNPYGKYGNPYSPDSINNPYSYGNGINR